jgi:3-hydroxypropanoate dehydrogenase
MIATPLNSASRRVNEAAYNILFRDARTYNTWLDQPIEDELLHQLYDLMKWGPTSSNCCPARIVFLRTREAKERLRPALSPGNVDKTMKAPVTAILAYDAKFYELMPRLFPPAPGMKDMFAQAPELAAVTAMRNGTLQGGYFILAARSLGLDCGPMSGFDNAKVDREFFSVPIAGSGAVKSNFLCNLGYGDVTRLHPRGPRLEFSEACQVL